MEQEVKMASHMEVWHGYGKAGSVKDITLCVTEDCNLACKYCYMTGKNNKKRMTLDTAKNCVEYILNNQDFFKEDSVVWNFIGGEPFLEIDLIDKVCDYIKLRMFELNHPWFDSYRFNFATNGILYNTEKVQKFIKKNRAHVSIGISVDGNKEKHDLQRVYRDGSGSYDDVIKNVELWLKQFPDASTKATFSSDDLIHLKDSIISLWENGIKNVSANVVFENVWKEGDDLIFESQLNELGDYILENQLWDKYRVRFFEPHIGNKLNKSNLNRGVCGSGKMLAVDCNGQFYPCIRFLDFSLNKRKGLTIGNVETGMLEDKLRPFKALSFKEISDDECLNCDVASGCAWCVGHNYDEYGTLFSRAKYICKMHKANVRANKRFWRKYEQLTGNISPRRKYESINDKKFLQLMLNDNMTTTCLYEVPKEIKQPSMMTKELIDKAIKFADDNDYEIVLLGDVKSSQFDIGTYYAQILSSESKCVDEKSILVYDNCVKGNIEKDNIAILLINKENIANITEYVEELAINKSRINLILQGINEWNEDDLTRYDNELEVLEKSVENIFKRNRDFEINILTDRLSFKEHSSCDSGENTITLAPDGNFYICPAFYFDKIDECLGNIDNGIDIEFVKKIFTMSNNVLCKNCDSFQCKQCKYLNKKYTGEYNISPKNQCLISNLERNKSKTLQDSIVNDGNDIKGLKIDSIECIDPLVKLGRGE